MKTPLPPVGRAGRAAVCIELREQDRRGFQPPQPVAMEKEPDGFARLCDVSPETRRDKLDWKRRMRSYDL